MCFGSSHLSTCTNGISLGRFSLTLFTHSLCILNGLESHTTAPAPWVLTKFGNCSPTFPLRRWKLMLRLRQDESTSLSPSSMNEKWRNVASRNFSARQKTTWSGKEFLKLVWFNYVQFHVFHLISLTSIPAIVHIKVPSCPPLFDRDSSSIRSTSYSSALVELTQAALTVCCWKENRWLTLLHLICFGAELRWKLRTLLEFLSRQTDTFFQKF